MNLDDYRIKAYKAASSTQKKGKNKTSELPEDSIKINKTAQKSGSLKSAQSASQNSTRASLSTKKSAKEYVPDPSVKQAADVLTQGGLLKVPAPENGKEDVYRRVAKFLILIGVDQAALVLKHLTQEETEKIIPEITAVRKIEPQEALEILEEFNSIKERVKEGGGTHTAQLILEKAFGKQRAQDLMSHLNIEEEKKPFEYLVDKSSEQILLLLKGETNTVKALVFSYLPPQKAADVINKLGDNDKKEVIIHLAKQKNVSPEVIERVDKVIHEKSLAQIDVKTNSIDGKSVLAEILKKMDFKAEQDILSNIKDEDPLLGDQLQEKLFTFDDVINSDDKFIQNYLRELTDLEIAYLVADKKDDFRVKIFSNMSQAREAAILDEEQIHKPMLKKDCNEITQKFCNHLRRAWERGELYISGRDDEEYV